MKTTATLLTNNLAAIFIGLVRKHHPQCNNCGDGRVRERGRYRALVMLAEPDRARRIH